MRTHRTSIIAASVTFGLVLWGIGALLGLLFLGEGGAAVWLTPGLAAYVWAGRLLAMACAVGFGLLLARVVAKWRASQSAIEHADLVLTALRGVDQIDSPDLDLVETLQLICDELTRTGAYRAAGVVLAGNLDGGRPYAQSGFGEPFQPFALGLTDDDLAFLALPAAVCPVGPAGALSPGRGAASPLEGLPGEDLSVVVLPGADDTLGSLIVREPEGVRVQLQPPELLRQVAGNIVSALHRSRAAPPVGSRRCCELFLNAPVGLFQMTTGGRIVATNAAMASILGCETPGDAVLHFDGLVHELSCRDRWAEFVTRVGLLGEVWDFECEVRKRDGTPAFILMNARVQDDGDGEKGTVVGHARDVTEHKAAEEALGESRRTLATLVSNLPGMVYQCRNDEAWTMLYVSDGCRDLTGYEPEQLVNNRDLSYSDLIVPEDREMVQASVQNGLARELPFELSYRIRTASGEVRWVWEQGLGIVPADGVAPPDVGAVILEGLVLDITHRKLIEAEREALLDQVRSQAEQLRGTATQLQQIMSTVPEGVLLLDGEGHVVLANPAAEQALADLDADIGASGRLSRLGDRSLEELLTSPQRRGLWHEIKLRTRVFEAMAKPVESGPTPEGWVLVINDVTREREILQRTQQQERLAAVGQLAAGIAHDFNNVMAVIVLYSQMALRAPDLAPKLKDQLQTIAREGNRAGELIQQILDFGRRGVLEPVPIDLVPFFMEQVRLLRRTLPEDIRTSFTYGRDVYVVNADASRLRQAIMNLALNARDAMPSGGDLAIVLGRTVENSLERALLAHARSDRSPAGTWVEIAVTDTGVGIPPETVPRLFEPFFTTKGTGGNGLGLAQVHGIVSQHNGTIDVSSVPGEGTKFTICLPALPGLPEGDGATGSAPVLRGNGELVLVVEDNGIVRRSLANALDFQGYQIITAPNGREAMALLETYTGPSSPGEAGAPGNGKARSDAHVDLILCDLVMPEMGGQALFHAVRERGWTMPFVMLSGHPMEAELETLRAQGVAAWILKPPDLDQLARVIAEVLGKDAG